MQAQTNEQQNPGQLRDEIKLLKRGPEERKNSNILQAAKLRELGMGCHIRERCAQDHLHSQRMNCTLHQGDTWQR